MRTKYICCRMLTYLLYSYLVLRRFPSTQLICVITQLYGNLSDSLHLLAVGVPVTETKWRHLPAALETLVWEINIYVRELRTRISTPLHVQVMIIEGGATENCHHCNIRQQFTYKLPTVCTHLMLPKNLLNIFSFVAIDTHKKPCSYSDLLGCRTMSALSKITGESCPIFPLFSILSFLVTCLYRCQYQKALKSNTTHVDML